VKYGDHVRAIKFGEHGALGIHVKNTGEIWYFKIVSEELLLQGFDVSNYR
jgi:alanyl-tRNA synthetase